MLSKELFNYNSFVYHHKSYFITQLWSYKTEKVKVQLYVIVRYYIKIYFRFAKT